MPRDATNSGAEGNENQDRGDSYDATDPTPSHDYSDITGPEDFEVPADYSFAPPEDSDSADSASPMDSSFDSADRGIGEQGRFPARRDELTAPSRSENSSRTESPTRSKNPSRPQRTGTTYGVSGPHDISVKDRLPPQNLDAERCLLGTMMLSREAVGEVIPIIGKSDVRWFYRPDHRTLFEVLVDIYDHNEPIDLVVVCNELQRRKN